MSILNRFVPRVLFLFKARVATSLEASITPIVHSNCRNIGVFRAADDASPRNAKPKTEGNPIITMIFPIGKTPCGGATRIRGVFDVKGSSYINFNEKYFKTWKHIHEDNDCWINGAGRIAKGDRKSNPNMKALATDPVTIPRCTSIRDDHQKRMH